LSETKPNPVVPRDEHNVSRANISKNALKVLYRLKDAGYRACLVGGGVRDLLLGREPKDFDIVCDATPEEIRSVFRNCRLIGRRFRLAHVYFRDEIIEVATFRGGQEQAESTDEGRILRDNVYGTIEEDVWRRDFTVNALYYDISDFSVLDYTGGLKDLKQGQLRMIGDPEQRYREDPVRMLRAVRFAAKLGFRIEPSTEGPIFALGYLLGDIPPARLFDEVLKLFQTGHGENSFELLRRYDLLAWLFPELDEFLAVERDEGDTHRFISLALENTDARLAEDKGANPGFLYAALLWGLVERRARRLRDERDMSEAQALAEAGRQVIDMQVRSTAIPKRFSIVMKEIWSLQPRFSRHVGKRAVSLLGHPRFRAAYDFLCLRARAGDKRVADDCQFWTELQELDPEDQRKRLLPPRKRKRPKKGNKAKS